MPLPLILGAAAGAAALAGIGGAVNGGAKMKKANDKIQGAKRDYDKSLAYFEERNQATMEAMDVLGKMELEILSSFERFSDIFERIQNRPEFKAYRKDDVEIPSYNPEELKTASVGAGVLLGGLGGAALGTAGGFAAAGATTAAVMALGTASTGTAIASLSGVAATNATLAALGGGAIAAGGGGMALGSAILSATTLGASILVGGIIFNFTGSAMNKKADKTVEQAAKAKSDVYTICAYLWDLYNTEQNFEKSLTKVNKVYQQHLNYLEGLVVLGGKTDWITYTDQEKLVTENTALLVNLLFQMCKVQLVLVTAGDNELNKINHEAVDEAVGNANGFLDSRGFPSLA